MSSSPAARIDGVEYGTSFLTAAEAPPLAAAPLDAFPNPFTHTVTLRFTPPVPQTLRLEVFDVLGRVVYQRDAGPVAGAQVWELPGQAWAAGVYVVRLTGSAGWHHTARLTRR